MAAPLSLVLMIDILTTTIHLGITAFFKCSALIALLLIISYLAIAIIIMISWTFCAMGYDHCNAKMYKTKYKRALVNIVTGFGGCLYLIGDNLQHLQNIICELTKEYRQKAKQFQCVYLMSILQNIRYNDSIFPLSIGASYLCVFVRDAFSYTFSTSFESHLCC